MSYSTHLPTSNAVLLSAVKMLLDSKSWVHVQKSPPYLIKLGVLLLQDFQKIKCTVELLDQALTEIKTQVPGIAKHQQQQVCHWNLVRIPPKSVLGTTQHGR